MFLDKELMNDLCYFLPNERIAQSPIEPRDNANLLVVNREKLSFEDCIVRDLPNFLYKGDLIILNNTKVIKARLYAITDTSAKVEILLIKKIDIKTGLFMTKPGKRLKKGKEIIINNKKIGIVKDVDSQGRRIIEFYEEIDTILEEFGMIPIPPYVKKFSKDFNEKYQTKFANVPGSVAAPTAGLHFTDNLLEELREKGVLIKFITLHVGPGTFKSLSNEGEVLLEPEWVDISQDVCDSIKKAKGNNNKILVVGTTTMRTVESTNLEPYSGYIDTIILPGYNFKVPDMFMTNFHLPKTSLLALTMAFGGIELIKKAYSYAIENDYRFYSFGDAMLII
ncbi:S-adenosylmethionine:tRNA ribosyltransferase-isomerase [Thermodesulfobium acidiphilum]|uniref:S-adenosylmethionine:tRNA ribosyltransferase-isomerase n=1 Tax=Thermodesulfobium acidiphilum TaxID=1794699 RepID=A0A2R4VZQ5_THEAF|nr:tRNA preQ1(34) S-adenosylmethionine ribosyltransferase-isomerase QueA [Thermodesulfobium acidiphilum]AWB09992.1 S-adenosylmethionine:tRNA ribosyltransferase-isomerase [Thermodesulfobium acidiphilum]PMP86350.1 MAG: tRNA preQ1(34) S-adenosylmethionine ribosyltransferase-isomerase QueA [Thermodesulfobium narugense]